MFGGGEEEWKVKRERFAKRSLANILLSRYNLRNPSKSALME